MITRSVPAPKVTLPLRVPLPLAGNVSVLLPDKSVNGPLLELSQIKLSFPAVGRSVQAAREECGQPMHRQIEMAQTLYRHRGRSQERLMLVSAFGWATALLPGKKQQVRRLQQHGLRDGKGGINHP